MKKLGIKMSAKRMIFNMLFVVLVLIFMMASFYDFTKRVEDSVHQRAKQTLNEIGNEGALLLETQISRDMAFLRTEASIMVADGTFNDLSIVVRNLTFGQENYNFDRMTFIKPDGTAYTSTGEVGNLAHREYFQSALSGKETVSNIVISKFSGKESFALAVPVYDKGQIIGVLSGTYVGNSFSDVVNMEFYGNNSVTYVVQPDGTYILKPQPNGKEAEEWSTKGDTQQEIVEKMDKGESGYASFTDGEKNWQLSYVPTDINDWYVVTLVPEQIIMEQTEFIKQIAVILCVKIILALVAVSIYIIVLQRQSLKREQARQEILDLDNSRYRVLLENMESLFFEWDLELNTVTCSKEWIERMGYEPDAETIKNGGFVGEQEQLSFSGFIEAIQGGLAYSEEEYQLVSADDQSFWCRIRLLGVENQFGKVRRIMGLIEDIDDRKQREADLMNEAKRDSLTNLFNKMATEEQITFSLKNDMRDGFCHGFMLLDIDNFKGINDTYGHNKGDRVLKDVADGLVKLCRSSDVVGRIGGDEFVVFMRSVKDVQQVCKKAEEIVREIKTVEVAEGVLLTCSLGVAIAKGSNCSFEVLYSRADKAMYIAKKGGKNQFAFYEA